MALWKHVLSHYSTPPLPTIVVNLSPSGIFAYLTAIYVIQELYLLFYLIISKYHVHLILDISNPALSVISITHGMELKVCLQFGSKSSVKESMCETSIYL